MTSSRGLQPHEPGRAEALSDALVFFGATGDLAYKQIFPALHALVRRGHLDAPIIGVANAGWTLAQLKDRARGSVQEHGGLDEKAFDRLSSLMRYVDGDYRDPETFVAIHRELGKAQRPLHYLAIPPSLFEVLDLPTGPRPYERGTWGPAEAVALGRACGRLARPSAGALTRGDAVPGVRVACSLRPSSSPSSRCT